MTMVTMADCRCECGKLVARATERGLELKCRGCKRIIMVSFGDGAWRVTAGSDAVVQDIPVTHHGQRPAQRPEPHPSLAREDGGGIHR